MARTTRTTAAGSLLVRDGLSTRSPRRPQATTRRSGTRAAVIAAALRDATQEA